MKRMEKRSLRQAGFSLIDAAIGLVLFSLVGMGLYQAYQHLYRFNAHKTRVENLQAGRAALLDFLRANGYLPCPDGTGDGKGDRTTSPPHKCRFKYGYLPWADLGIERKAATDGQGHFIYYHVNQKAIATSTLDITDVCESIAFFAPDGAGAGTRATASGMNFYVHPNGHYYCGGAALAGSWTTGMAADDPRVAMPPYAHLPTQPVGASSAGKGNLTVRTADGTGTDVLTDSALAVLVAFDPQTAHAKWRNGGPTLDCSTVSGADRENCDGDRFFLARAGAAGGAQDLIRWIDVLQARQVLLEAGKL